MIRRVCGRARIWPVCGEAGDRAGAAWNWRMSSDPSSTTKPVKPVIGLAGGIGAGKSLVGRQLADLGCALFDADHVARRELEDPAVISTLVGWWGAGILDQQGGVDRAKIAARIFCDPAERVRLEGLIHPRVARNREDFMAAAFADPGVRAIVLDVPLLFEIGLDKICTHILFVHADDKVRQERVRSSRGWDAGELARREKNQWPLDRKLKSANNVIDNGEGEAQCLAQVRATFDRITTEYNPPPGGARQPGR